MTLRDAASEAQQGVQLVALITLLLDRLDNGPVQGHVIEHVLAAFAKECVTLARGLEEEVPAGKRAETAAGLYVTCDFMLKTLTDAVGKFALAAGLAYQSVPTAMGLTLAAGHQEENLRKALEYLVGVQGPGA